MPGGRPPKLTKEYKYQVYAYHVAGFPVWEIAKKFDCSERTIHNVLNWAREQIPKFDKKQNLLDALHATSEMIKDLNLRKRQILDQLEEESKKSVDLGPATRKTDRRTTNDEKGRRYHWNAYLGIMRQLRECHCVLHKLLGLEKMTLEVDGDTLRGLHDILGGKWKPKLPEDLPENARRSISGEGMEEELADHAM